MRQRELLYVALMIGLLSACEDDAGEESLLCFLEDQGDGTQLLTCDNGFDHVMSNGRDGVDGEPGASALLDLSTEPPGDNCAGGGVRIEQTVDGQAVGDPEFLCNDNWIAEVDALEARIADLEADNAALEAAVESDLTAIDERLTEVEPLNETAVRLIRENTTLNVPADYATVNDALDFLEGYVIARDVNVDIKLADGTYEFTEPLFLAHPSGGRIRLIGNPGNSDAVVLSFTNSSGIRAGRLGWVEGLTLRGDGTPGNNGIEAGRGGFVRLAADVIIEDFGRSCIRASQASAVEADGVTVRDCGEDGFAAVLASSISAPGASSTGNGRYGFFAGGSGGINAPNSDASENGDYGFQAVYGSGMFTENSTANDNTNIGFHAFAGSGIRADGSTASGNGLFGFVAGMSAGITVNNGLADDNGEAGFMAYGSSSLRANDAVTSNNGGDGLIVSHGSYASAFGIDSDNNAFRGLAANGTSTLDANEALVTNNLRDGIAVHGYSFANIGDSTVTDNGTFGVNVFWGAWINADGVTSTGHEFDFNLPPTTEVFDHDWGIIHLNPTLEE